LIFTGTLSYSANLTGLQWFLEKVFPKIQEKAPHVKLLITGRSENIPLPPAKNLIRTGYVEDIRPLIASAWISIAPILEGGGTRLKILEAMAIGTPVIATSKGAEGLQIQNNQHILLADTPEQFAAATLHLLQDSKLRLKLVENSCHLVREHYDWGVIMPDFLKLVEEAVHD
jgi:glycosyltransferase involved in cell wall biosynthesis